MGFEGVWGRRGLGGVDCPILWSSTKDDEDMMDNRGLGRLF